MFVVKVYNLDPSSYKVKNVNVKVFNSLEESQRFIVEEHYKISFDNDDTDLELDEFLSKNSFDSIVDELYDTFEFEIIED